MFDINYRQLGASP